MAIPGARSARQPLAGSFRQPAPGARATGTLDVSQSVAVTVVLRRRRHLPAAAPVAGEVWTAQELTDRAGAAPQDVTEVQDVLRRHGLTILTDTAWTARTRLVQAEGSVGALAELFGAQLEQVSSPHPHTGEQVAHRQRTGDLTVPAELADLVTAVLGLDDRPQARAQFRVWSAATSSAALTPLQIGAAYRFPAGTDGNGQTLAVIELGGGYDTADLQTYFSGLGLAVPQVQAVGVDGAGNVPGGDPTGADGEVLLDIEVAGALAPAASLVVYFAPNTDAGFLDAVATAVHATPTPTAVSISWGQQEDAWTGQARSSLDAALADAARLGVTVCVAAGDDGSTDRATDGRPHVDFPASSPHALGCGGTALRLTSSGAIGSESVWNNPGHGATGGGVSDTFPLPTWQQTAGVPAVAGGPGGRGVPDVAGDADPATGYQVLVDGTATVIGGTSAVAPLWAALVCRLAQALGRPLGLLQPALYDQTRSATPSPGLHDITTGSNGRYHAAPGWDPCTGLGTPDGTALLAHLRATAPPTTTA